MPGAAYLLLLLSPVTQPTPYPFVAHLYPLLRTYTTHPRRGVVSFNLPNCLLILPVYILWLYFKSKPRCEHGQPAPQDKCWTRIQCWLLLTLRQTSILSGTQPPTKDEAVTRKQEQRPRTTPNPTCRPYTPTPARAPLVLATCFLPSPDSIELSSRLVRSISAKHLCSLSLSATKHLLLSRPHTDTFLARSRCTITTGHTSMRTGASHLLACTLSHHRCDGPEREHEDLLLSVYMARKRPELPQQPWLPGP